MAFISEYDSPLGIMSIACDDTAILGLWFNGQKYFDEELPKPLIHEETYLIRQAKHWLDIYFTGNQPDFLPPLRYESTPFRRMVYEIILTIPYGKSMTYGQIATIIAKKKSISKMSAQAVGSAVGHNPILLMIPCHRVIGTNGNLIGYSGGINRKVKLLELENIECNKEVNLKDYAK